VQEFRKEKGRRYSPQERTLCWHWSKRQRRLVISPLALTTDEAGSNRPPLHASLLTSFFSFAAFADRTDSHDCVRTRTGELALLYNSPRSSTVLAVTDGELWRVKRDAFRSIIYRSSSALRLRFLRQVPVLSVSPQRAECCLCSLGLFM